MTKELKSARFILSLEPSLLDRVDEWRRQQPDIPSRAEAFRRLVESGLDMKAVGYVAPDPSKTRLFHQGPLKDYSSQ